MPTTSQTVVSTITDLFRSFFYSTLSLFVNLLLLSIFGPASIPEF